ncbi:MAG: hypothetical protein Q9207_003519 [Kuettlingeria erythrocarpa]
MSSIDLATPPSKKRKTITTYGSQGRLSRVWRAVRDAVPTSFISLGYDDPHSSTEQSNESQGPISSEDNKRLDAIAREEQISHGMNGFGRDVNDCDATAHEDQQTQGSTRRSSKKLRDRPETPDITPSRTKRRKYNTDANADAEGPEEEVRNSTPRSLRSLKNLKPSQGHQGADDGADASTEGTTPQTTIEVSNEQAPRRLRLPSLKAEPLSSTSTPGKAKTPKTPSSTPRRKRGRPPKYTCTTAAAQDPEEAELGFREILTKERPSVPGRSNSQRGTGTTSGKRLIRRKSSHSSGEYAEDPPNVNLAEQKKVEAAEQRLSLNVRSPSPGRTGELQSADGVNNDSPLEYQDSSEIPDTLRKPLNKLRRSLQTSSTDSIQALKCNLLQSLAGRRPLINMDEEYRKVQQLITQTVLAGEGNSMLVIGPRGCGKTALVETVLSDLALEHSDDFITVRLNGFIHTDDKLALREIWRQLGREVMADEEKEGPRTNYADTLTSLLALLAHSPEDEGKTDVTTRSVVFIIDEFDLFASHPRQTLLYNLFDIAQSRNAPIAVLGLTTRTNIIESLEKRVKSRFGQRYVNLTHPRTFNSFREMCKSALTSHQSADTKLPGRLDVEKKQVAMCRGLWNEYVDAMFTDDRQLEVFLRHLFARSRCGASFVSACQLPIIQLSSSSIPSGSTFMEQSLLPSDSKLQLLSSLSDLELSLLIAAARLDVILDTDVCNFAMVYEEYVQLAGRVKAQSSAAGQTAVGGGARVWGKEAGLGAWEKLMELELVLPVSVGGSSDGSRGMYRVDVALEEIGPSCPRMVATMSKWCREI